MPVLVALMLVLSLIAAPGAVTAETPPTVVKQIDLAKKLVETFGWSEGLPENPVEKDYLAILTGNRTFKFEAEAIYDSQTDAVSVRNYPLFGAFSGSGWLHGSSVATAIHFRAFIPVSGHYTLKAAARGDEQLWSIAGRAFKVRFGESLQERRVGQVFIPSGSLEFNTLIPPGAGIDYLILTAPDLAAIGPAAGWDFSAPLTAAALAETASSLLANEQLLPDDPAFPSKTLAASSAPLPAGAQLTELQIYGKPVAASWVRASQVPTALAVPLTIDTSGVYRIRIRCLGAEITAGFGARTVTIPAAPALGWVDFGTFRLPKGAHTLEIQLPPAGGADVIEISRKRSTPTDYLSVNKLDKKADAVVTPEELAAVMKSLQEQFKERK